MQYEIKRHWSEFYNHFHTIVPSPFAATVAIELTGPRQIIDIGCGNARDTFFFTHLGHRVLGLDIADSAIRSNRMRAQQQKINGIAFAEADVAAPNALADILARLERDGAPLVIYARFFFHAVTKEEETLVLACLSQHLPAGADCFFEFRTKNDAKTHKRFGGHYRRFIDLDEFIAAATARSFECVYQVEGQGMAKFREEDPVVGRVYLRHL